MIRRLILGTAALGGTQYGIKQGAVAKEEAMEVFRAAWDSGIYRFDTSPDYGQAEEWLAEFLRETSGYYPRPEVFTKTKGDREQAMRSRRIFHPDVARLLWHNWDFPFDHVPKWCDGATIYEPQDISADERLPWLQIPWNLLTQWEATWPKAGAVLGRSVFLQGLLSGERVHTEQPFRRCEDLAAFLGVDLATLALRAALEEKRLAGVVIGPQTVPELMKCVAIANRPALNAHHLWWLLDTGKLNEQTDPRKFGK